MIKRKRLYFALSVLLAASLFLGLTPGTSSALPKAERAVMDNGVVLLLSEDHSLPFVTMQLIVDAGSRRDPATKEGLAGLTARCMLLGTTSIKVAEISEQLDFLGASLHASTNRDYAGLNLRVLKKDIGKGLDLFMDTLTNPAFLEDEIRKEIEKTAAAIQSEEDQPEDVAEKAFMRTLFPQNPYGHPVEGTRESVAGLNRDDILKFYNTYYHPDIAVLTIVGDVTMDELKSGLFPRIEKWMRGTIPQEAFNGSYQKEKKTVKIDREITQANIVIGHEGISRENPDYYAITVMNYILGGGGFASRLTEEIRNKRGLAYDVHSFFDPGKYPGSFQVMLQTRNASAREAIEIAGQQMALIAKEPVSEKELDGAKNYLIGSFPTRFDTQAKLVNFLTQVEYYHLGLDYPQKYPSLIRAVTTDEVLRVAGKYIHPDESILVIVGNLKEAAVE